MNMRNAHHEVGPAFGPCESGQSYYCSGAGTAKLDLTAPVLRLAILCPECTGYRTTLAELSEGEQDQTTADLDMIYGMGAAA